jgi:hypothetical protein
MSSRSLRTSLTANGGNQELSLTGLGVKDDALLKRMVDFTIEVRCEKKSQEYKT